MAYNACQSSPPMPGEGSAAQLNRRCSRVAPGLQRVHLTPHASSASNHALKPTNTISCMALGCNLHCGRYDPSPHAIPLCRCANKGPQRSPLSLF